MYPIRNFLFGNKPSTDCYLWWRGDLYANLNFCFALTENQLLVVNLCLKEYSATDVFRFSVK